MKRLTPLLAVLLIGSASGRPGADSFGGATVHVVEIHNFAFTPDRVDAMVGDSVVWINRDVAPHTATDSTGGWNSGELKTGESWSRVVTETGPLPYLCDYHPSMRGAILVRPEVGP